MRLLDVQAWGELAQSLRRHPWRTSLTGLGVAWGMLMLVVMLAFGRGLHEGVMRSLGEYTAQTVWIWPERTSLAHAGRGPGRTLSIRIDDLSALEHGLAGLAALSPRNHLGRDDDAPVAVTQGERHGSFAVSGEDFDMTTMRAIEVDRGRWMNPLDVAERRKIAFIGAKVHAQLFGPDEPAVGQAIEIGGVEFTVGGVFRLRRKGSNAERQEHGIIVPWTTLAQTFGPRDRVSSVAMLADARSDPRDLATAAQALLGRRHQVHPDDRVAFDTWSTYEDAHRFETLFSGLELLVWIVGGFTLFAAALGVGNVMLVAVRERTAEIGLRKALGCTRADVVGEVVLEAMVLTVSAGALGLLAAVTFVETASGILCALPPEQRVSMLASPHVDLPIALAGLGLLCAAGLAASYVPAKAAANIQPATALQTE